MSVEVMIYQAEDNQIELEVEIKEDTVWLNINQMAELFNRDKSVISRHIKNIYKEGELVKDSTVAKNATVQNENGRAIKREIDFYNLDVIISVGYRVKSKEGVLFRKWATNVIRDYIVRGYVINQKRVEDLKVTINVLQRTRERLDSKQVLDVIEMYATSFDLLDRYDNKDIQKPNGRLSTYVLTYDECRAVIDKMKYNAESDLFGREINNSLDSAIYSIYQTFDGLELYPTIEDKASHLLYFLIKDHKMYDGNKRIATALFLYFLDKNDSLIINGQQVIGNDTLVAIVLMIAESKPEEMELLINLVMTFLSK